jgi:hypothetical protein
MKAMSGLNILATDVSLPASFVNNLLPKSTVIIFLTKDGQVDILSLLSNFT